MAKCNASHSDSLEWRQSAPTKQAKKLAAKRAKKRRRRQEKKKAAPWDPMAELQKLLHCGQANFSGV